MCRGHRSRSQGGHNAGHSGQTIETPDIKKRLDIKATDKRVFIFISFSSILVSFSFLCLAKSFYFADRYGFLGGVCRSPKFRSRVYKKQNYPAVTRRQICSLLPKGLSFKLKSCPIFFSNTVIGFPYRYGRLLCAWNGYGFFSEPRILTG